MDQPKKTKTPEFTEAELRAIHKRLGTAAYNPYDKHHDPVNSVVKKLDHYFGAKP